MNRSKQNERYECGYKEEGGEEEEEEEETINDIALICK